MSNPAISIAVNGSARIMAISGDPAWFRKTLSLTISGTTATPANMIVMMYQRNTLVALGESFSGPNGAVIGDLETNTTELEAFFKDVQLGAAREFDLYLYDSSVPDLLASGSVYILATKDYSAATPIPPISSTTQFIGCFAFYNGATYIRSTADGLYYLFQADGSGDTVTESLETTGITIPGSP